MVVKIKRSVKSSPYSSSECIYEVYTGVTHYKHNTDTRIIDLKLDSVNPITVTDVICVYILKC